MNKTKYEYIGRWVTKTLPEISAIALQQLSTKRKFSDYKDVPVLFEVFSKYHNINFPECVKNTTSREATECKMQFVTLLFCCFEPAVIRGPYHEKISKNTDWYLSQLIHTHRTQISQYLPKAGFYMRALNDFESEIISVYSGDVSRNRWSRCLGIYN